MFFLPGYKHRVRIVRPTVELEMLEAEDTLFRNKSAVFLPEGLPEENPPSLLSAGRERHFLLIS